MIGQQSRYLSVESHRYSCLRHFLLVRNSSLDGNPFDSLIPRLKREGCKAHENTAARFGQRSVGNQAGDHVLASGHGFARYFDAILSVDADDYTGGAVDFTVDPNFAVVID